ncbi:MAG: zinc-ribbon domain-containing protein [Anaerolineales bacterium]
MIMLLIGFGAIALAAVILPLLERTREDQLVKTEAAPAEREAAALTELRDLEFDHRLGKLSEEDYRDLRAQLVRRAVATLKVVDAAHEAEAARAKELDDLIEREVAVRRQARRQAAANGQKKCPDCGKAVAPDDRFCAKCGHALVEPDAAPLPQTATLPSPVVRRAPNSNTRSTKRNTQHAISRSIPVGRTTRPVSKWLLAAGIAIAVWAGVVGVLYFRARAAFDAQRPIATVAAADYRALAILPADPNFVFFGHRDGLMWSSDGGANWQPASVRGNVLALAVHPAAPLRIYLAGRDLFLRSDDGGRNWAEVAADLPGRDIQALAMAPNDPDVLYAFVVGQGLWRSANGGVNWKPVDTTLVENVTALAITSGTIYVGTDSAGVLRSDDGGATWASANGIVNGALDSPRVRALVYDPATGTLYAGTDRGLSFATNVGAGWTRRPFNGDVAALALGPDGVTMLLITSAGEVFRSRDRGVTWGE